MNGHMRIAPIHTSILVSTGGITNAAIFKTVNVDTAFIWAELVLHAILRRLNMFIIMSTGVYKKIHPANNHTSVSP